MNGLWKRFTRPAFILLSTKPKIDTRTLQTICNLKNFQTVSTTTSLHNKSVFLELNRSKSKKAQYESDEEDDDFSEDSSLSRDSKVVKLNTTSLRTDLVLKSALGIARNKIEQQFYESKIRVNGKKIMKKSTSVRVGDEIDVIKSVSPKNPDHLYVSRVEILNVAAKEESIVITARRFKSLLIDNYEIDPYKKVSDVDPDNN